MGSEQFSLCWDNFHTNMSNGLTSFLKSEDLVDVTLAVEGRQLKAHKMILSVCSPYFKELFQSNPCPHPIVFLKDVSFTMLSNLLEFMYQGEVKVSQDELGSFIKTAEALKVKGLTGDGPAQLENKDERVSTPVQNHLAPTEPSTIIQKVTREKTPPRKKMLGPASKRFKNDNPPKPDAQPNIEVQPKLENVSENYEKQSPECLPPMLNLKVEPEESAVSLANEEAITYEESTMDELGLENSTDYVMESSEMEVKAGTSTNMANIETPGENQGLYKFVVTQLGTLNLVLHHHLYRPRNLLHGTPKRLWICTWRDKHCPARAISFAGKLIAKRGMHCHPPQKEAIAAKEAAGQICYRQLF